MASRGVRARVASGGKIVSDTRPHHPLWWVGYWLIQLLAAIELLVLFAILNLSRFLH